MCLTGDVTRPGLGLSWEQRAWVEARCDRLLHSAASLTLVGNDRRRDPWLTNLTGTQHVVELCREAGVRELHHVSTAYVCGARSGTIYESEIDVGQEFLNDYAATKLASEHCVRQAAWLDSLTVYRPALIVGDYHTGFTTSYHHLYRFMQFTSLIHQQAQLDERGRWYHPVRLKMTGEERSNLVPVDWVSAFITGVVWQQKLHNRTYHLAPRDATRTAEIEEALARYFNYYGVTFVGPHGIPDGTATELEQFFCRFVSTQDAYMRMDPVFDCTNTLNAAPELPCPQVDVACLERLIAFGVRDQWGKKVRQRRPNCRRGIGALMDRYTKTVETTGSGARLWSIRAGAASALPSSPDRNTKDLAMPAAPHKEPVWGARLWLGADLYAWMRFLVRNHFAVPPSHWHMAALISACSLPNSVMRFMTDAWFGGRVERTAIRRPPLFIVGHWRTGTTLLHELLICDPQHSYPTFCECLFPHHFLLTEKIYPRLFGFLMPKRRPMDNMAVGWDRPQEDELALCLLGEPSPYLTMAFPNHPPQDQDALDLERLIVAGPRPMEAHVPALRAQADV